MDLISSYLNEVSLNPLALALSVIAVCFLFFRSITDLLVTPSKSKILIEPALIFIVFGVHVQMVDLGFTIYTEYYYNAGLLMLTANIALSWFNGKAKELSNDISVAKQKLNGALSGAIGKEGRLNASMRFVILYVAVFLHVFINLFFEALAFACLWPLKLSYVLNGFMFKNKRKHMDCDLGK